MYKRGRYIAFFLGICITLVVVGGVFAALFISGKLVIGGAKTMQQKEAESFAKSPLKEVVVVASKINKGQKITPEKVTTEKRFENQLPDKVIANAGSVIGKIAAADMEKNTMVYESMIINPKDAYKPDERIKDYDLPKGLMGKDIVSQGDLIDVEFKRKDGSTAVVLAKKIIKSRLDDRIIIQTDWEERKLINYALTDKAENGGEIYAAKYMDMDQPASAVNYQPPSGLGLKSGRQSEPQSPRNNGQSSSAPAFAP
jgi:hypothetical protein